MNQEPGTDNPRVQHTRLRVQGVDSGINAKFSDTTGQHRGGVQMSECRGRGWIRQIISGHVDSLYGSDGALLGSGDTLLPVKQ